MRIDVIAQANPQRIVLEDVDQAIQRAQRHDLPDITDGAPIVPRRPGSVLKVRAISTQDRPFVSVQQIRLSVLQAEILTNLDARLQRADEQRLASLQSRLNANVEQTYLSRVGAIDDQAETGEGRASANDSVAAVNLLTKIRALTVNLLPPPTAPDGYWKSRLLARQAEFSQLETERQALINRIFADREQRRHDLRTQLQREADASLNEAGESARLRRTTVLTATRRRLQSQTADILASSKVLDFEAGTIAASAGGTPGQAIEGQAIGLPPLAVMTSTSRGDLIALQRERVRLQEQIWRQTLQTVSEVARSRKIVIVGYGRQAGVRDITPDLLKWVKADRWG